MTRLIGRRCKDSNVLSQPVLIGRGLDLASLNTYTCPVQLSRCKRSLKLSPFPVRTAEGPHPFPFRTRPLSPPAPMVLLGRPSGRVGPCRKTFELGVASAAPSSFSFIVAAVFRGRFRDAAPGLRPPGRRLSRRPRRDKQATWPPRAAAPPATPERGAPCRRACRSSPAPRPPRGPSAECGDRKSTRLNSSHVKISYAVFCLKKKKKQRASDETV